MTSLKEVFSNPNPKSKFITYMSLGDPSFDLSLEWAKTIIDSGSDILELGIPFSDPVADGGVIQKSYKRALENPFSMEKVFGVVKKIQEHRKGFPIVFLTYLNPIHAYGAEKFFKKCKSEGVLGVVIPDLPYDSMDSKVYFSLGKKYGIDIIQLITPSTSLARIREIKKNSSGFIYYVTSFGVTGERTSISKNLKARVLLLKKEIGLPICSGFGISTKEQAGEISEYSDGVIIGSAIQRIIEENSANMEECKRKLNAYISMIRNSMKVEIF
ncbi:MAG: tryptophan synthase subunit alpha [Leptospiraceae bacterium]|nr:tryptophan synthase subunit alpha [Leptospiraceae bacterium]MCK6380106.1 tryptophan synthase subunit alpha [Leptospiraceae bacterium]NUM40521.1 tryptophan synthase subunit alpha [Leptospiraceae bacterium]